MQPEQAQLLVAMARGQHVPGGCCYVHGSNATWWKRADGTPVCGECHPCPETFTASAPLIRNVHTKK